MIDSEILAVRAQLARADAANERMRRALRRIRDIVCADGSLDEVSRWYHPQYRSLTSEGEAEIRRLADLALKAPESGR